MNIQQQVESARLLLQGDPLSQLLGYQILESLRAGIAETRKIVHDTQPVDGDAQLHFAAEAEQQLPAGYRLIPQTEWATHYA